MGNKELNLVRLDDSDFQAKMEELNEYIFDVKTGNYAGARVWS